MKPSQKTSVTLLSCTQFIPETVFVEWQISRTDGPVPSPEEVHRMINVEQSAIDRGVVEKGVVRPGPFETEVRKVFEDCVSMKVPIAETISFVFAVDHMPISMREQWVRHRIGHKYNFDFGFEQIPNIADSSWWSQTFRAKDMSKFAADGEFYEPEWLELYGDKAMETAGKIYCPHCGEEADYLPGNPGMYQCKNKHGVFQISAGLTVRHFWRSQHAWIASAYARMARAGMPLEDARNLLPLGCQHRMTWSTNLSALMHILSKRSCWIAQLGMWEPVVIGLVRELAKKVDPYFHRLVDPPCVGEDGHFKECKFHKENDEYIRGTDPHHPCPLWLYHHGSRASGVAMEVYEDGGSPTWHFSREPDASALVMDDNGWFWKPNRPHVTGTLLAEGLDFTARAKKYEQLWGRDPLTGERKQLS